MNSCAVTGSTPCALRKSAETVTALTAASCTNLKAFFHCQGDEDDEAAAGGVEGGVDEFEVVDDIRCFKRGGVLVLVLFDCCCMLIVFFETP